MTADALTSDYAHHDILQALRRVQTSSDWIAQAACANSTLSPEAWDPDWFDPTRVVHLSRAERARRAELGAQAQEICETLCPVQIECLLHGRSFQEWGTWGGEIRQTIPCISRVDQLRAS